MKGDCSTQISSGCCVRQREKVEEKAKEEKKVEEKEVGAKEVPQIGEMMMLLQQHILEQEAVWVFVKAAHEWYTKGLGETIMPPPVFPDWVLSDVGPSGHAQDKPTAAASNTPAPNKEKKKKAVEDEGDAGHGAVKSTQHLRREFCWIVRKMMSQSHLGSKATRRTWGGAPWRFGGPIALSSGTGRKYSVSALELCPTELRQTDLCNPSPTPVSIGASRMMKFHSSSLQYW